MGSATWELVRFNSAISCRNDSGHSSHRADNGASRLGASATGTGAGMGTAAGLGTGAGAGMAAGLGTGAGAGAGGFDIGIGEKVFGMEFGTEFRVGGGVWLN